MAKPQPLPDMTVGCLLKLWPDTATVARDLVLSHFTVAAWLRRGSIPVVYWDALVRAARRRGIQGVTYAVLRSVSVATKERKRTALMDVKANRDAASPERAPPIKAGRGVVQDALPIVNKDCHSNASPEKNHAA